MPNDVSTNPLSAYTNLAANSKIQFKAGSQAALNTMMQNGTAEEGTFYLTNDTHKLYVGRKKTSDNKVYPEQVSRGVTVVATAEELPNPAPSGAIEEGELFYITNKNILAALKYVPADNSVNPPVSAHYEWVQINPPTGITDVATAAVANGSDVNLVTTLTTGAGDQSGAFKVTAGNNITLTPSSTSITIGANVKNNQGNITISAKDTTYQLGVDTNTTKGVLELSADGSSNPSQTDTSVDIVGTQDGFTKVTSNATTGAINVAGVSFDTTNNAIAVTNHTTDGFQITLGGVKGDGDPFTVHSAVFTPHIAYGQAGTPEVAGFANGVATLDIYTKDETDSAIDDAIDAKLQIADAMTYKGTVDFSDPQTNFITIVENNGGPHNGDVYKISGIDASNPLEIDGKDAGVGDLIIFSGTENSSGVISYTANSLSSLLSHCDLVPSGDEPEVKATITPSATTSNPSTFQLYDGKVAGSNILTTKFYSGNKIDVTSDQTQNGSNVTGLLNVRFNHATTTRTDSATGSLTTEGVNDNFGVDTIGSDKVKLFVFDGSLDANNKVSGLTTDAYGHVSGVSGKIITFQHNYVSSITTSYNASQSKIGLTLNNAISTLSGALATLQFKSDTLAINGYVDNSNHANDALEINLVWGTF